jgi:DNA-binding NarL/FixJ family response regulator
MAARRIRVQIADDHDVVIQGLRTILSGEPDIEVVGEPIRSGPELWEAVWQTQPDVLLLDAKMSGFDLLIALDQLAEQLPRLKVLVVTALQDPQLAKAASKKHAAGYVLKEEALSALLPLAIRDINAGNVWFSPKASQFLLADETSSAAGRGLTEYQLAVLRLMVQGKTPDEIAAILERTVVSIYNAQRQIRDKLAVETNAQAMVVALNEGLVALKLE